MMQRVVRVCQRQLSYLFIVLYSVICMLNWLYSWVIWKCMQFCIQCFDVSCWATERKKFTKPKGSTLGKLTQAVIHGNLGLLSKNWKCSSSSNSRNACSGSRELCIEIACWLGCQIQVLVLVTLSIAWVSYWQQYFPVNVLLSYLPVWYPVDSAKLT